jgi:hypothetical protein
MKNIKQYENNRICLNLDFCKIYRIIKIILRFEFNPVYLCNLIKIVVQDIIKQNEKYKTI